jgi:hypothetical protein
VSSFQPCRFLILAHLARFAALIRARPAAEMRLRLGEIETTFWPRARAQRAFCEAEILARAAALILRGPCDTRVLFIPLSALIAVSRAFTCCAALSRSAFKSSIMSMCSPQRIVTGDQSDSGRPPLNQCNKRSQSIVNLIALLRAESVAFLYQVLMNRLACGFYTLRKFFEIKFDHSSVVQILPSGVGHGGLHAGVQGSVGGIPGKILRLGVCHCSTFYGSPQPAHSKGGVRAGFNILTGVQFRRGTFFEVKTSLYSRPAPTLRLILGYNF